MILITFSSGVHAAIEALTGEAMIRLPASGAGATVDAGEFTALMWIHPTSIGGDSPARLLTITDAMHVDLTPDGSVRVTLHSDTESVGNLSASTGTALSPNEWALIGVSFSAATAELTLRVASESVSPFAVAASDESFEMHAVGAEIHLGAALGKPGMLGVYAIVAMRDHVLLDADFASMWSSRRHHAPYSHDTTAAGGLMNGPDGCIWMVNHAITTNPHNSGAGGTQQQRAAIVGESVGVHNFHVLDQTGSGQSNFYRVVRKVNDVAGMVYRSPFDPSYGGFFIRSLPEFQVPLPEEPWVAGIAPKARQLATEPEGLVKVIISSNSRATLPLDRSERGSANFSQGFSAYKIERAAGILNRPARAEAEPWFSMDSVDSAPFVQGPTIYIEDTDFSRFWTGAGGNPRVGPGRGIRLDEQATYAMRCGPAGLLEADQPLFFRAHLLRYPGSSDLSWVPNKHDQQGEQGTDVGRPGLVPLNTAEYELACDVDGGNCSVDDKSIVLQGDHTAFIQPGHAVHVNGSISLITSVVFTGGARGTTTLKLEHKFLNSPVQGDVLQFGPWEFTTVDYLWPALDGEDPLTWRGMRLTAEPGGAGAVVFSFSAWRPGVDGYVFGPAGWGGHGYNRQINDSFKDAIGKWMQELAPDVWLQVFAQQNSQPSSMAAYGTYILDALPNVDLLWLGDIIHGDGLFENWNHYILNNAESFGVPAIALAQHPDLGDMLELYADGIRMDELHASQRGNEVMAALWTELLLEAALDDPHTPECIFADLNCDGVVDISDLLFVLANWGECDNCPAETCPADVNDDCVVDIFDLLFILANWG